MSAPKQVIVAEYTNEWAKSFQKLKAVYKRYLSHLIIDIQHVGSTSVPDLAAKPILDIDLIIENRDILDNIIPELDKLGYDHVGDLGVKDREAFKRRSEKSPEDGSGSTWHRHNLYVCIKDSLHLKNHLTLRDYLRNNPDKARQYGELKKKLALENPFNIEIYIEKKTPFVIEVLKEKGFDDESLNQITELNRAVK